MLEIPVLTGRLMLKGVVIAALSFCSIGAHSAESHVGSGISAGQAPIVVTPQSEERLYLPKVKPDAVIPIDAQPAFWPDELKSALASVVSKLRLNEKYVVRIRSLIPDGGSFEFSLGLAERALQRVRQELISLGVRPRQIVGDTERETASREIETQSSGVEIFLEPSAK